MIHTLWIPYPCLWRRTPPRWHPSESRLCWQRVCWFWLNHVPEETAKAGCTRVRKAATSPATSGVDMAFCAGAESLLEDVGASDVDLSHPRFHHAPQHILVVLGNDSQGLLKEERRHNVSFAGDDAKGHDGGDKLRCLCRSKYRSTCCSFGSGPNSFHHRRA